MYTDEHVKALRTKMAAARAGLVAVSRVLTAEQASRGRPDRMDSEEGWSPLEQLHHLWGAEVLYRDWAQAAVRSDRPDYSTMPMRWAPIDLEVINEHPIEEVLAGMTTERDRTEQFIDTLDLKDFARTGIHPIWGEITVMQILRSYYRHDGMHRMQIEGIEPEYQPSGVAADANQKNFRIPSVEIRQMTFGEFLKRADENAPFLQQ